MRRAWLALALAAAPARAQVDPGIAADRLVPAAGPTALIAVEGADLPPPDRTAAALAFGYLARPLAVANTFTSATVSHPVAAAATVDAAVELGLTRWLALGLGLPAVVWQRGDRLAGLGVSDADAERPLASYALGDVRLRAKLLLPGPARGLRIALVGILTLPAGGERDFAATSGPTFEPRLIAELARSYFAVAANLGVRFAPDRAVFASHFGDELDWGIGAIAGAWRLRGLVELAGAVGESTHPVEARAAARVLLPRGFAIDAGAGFALVSQPQSPEWRLFAVARWIR